MEQHPKLKRYRILSERLRTQSLDFYDKIIGICAGLMKHWEQIITWQKQGIKKKMSDLLVAANAKIANYPILTRNISDFSPLAMV